VRRFYYDFGRIIQVANACILTPTTTQMLQEHLAFGFKHNLAMTIRGKGMSQSGQSLPTHHSAVISMQHINQCKAVNQQTIWVDANASWADVLARTLPHNLMPYVVPYNCNLSIGGVLSVGGIGASSFKYGSAAFHVKALEIIQPDGELVKVAVSHPLAQACLGGQGLFGIIKSVCLNLRPYQPFIKTFCLVYENKATWLNDLIKAKSYADYIESFCSPMNIGSKITNDGRKPVAKWFYIIHISLEYTQHAPILADLPLSPSYLGFEQEDNTQSFLFRHNTRLHAMKTTGHWQLSHPWYECFVTAQMLENLTQILTTLPPFYANMVQVIPVSAKFPVGFLMMPEAQDVFSVMILNLGVLKKMLPMCLQSIDYLDDCFLPQGGKRYLSGFIPRKSPSDWQAHFGEQYPRWRDAKAQFDPKNLLQSYLFNQL
tara:strand:- start:1892 stop:3181 length:1290 start_codon:yes stop_codon:yes gene_type:complete